MVNSSVFSQLKCSLLVVGAGPAGIAAAVTAADHGADVLLVDDNPAPGGQIWRGMDPRVGGAAGRWLARLASSKVRRLSGATVVTCPETNTVVVDTADGARCIRHETAILCTGSRERFLPFPGWTLPGVTGAGGLQALVKGGLEVAGQRVLVAGSGPLLIAVAGLMRAHGASIPAILEQTPGRAMRSFQLGLIRYPSKIIQGLPLLPLMLRHHCDAWVVRAEGAGRVERAVVSINGRTSTIPCDRIACGFNLIPSLDVPLAFGCRVHDGVVEVDAGLRTSVPTVWCAGESLGIGGVDAALCEGVIAGHQATGHGHQAESWQSRRRSARSFAALLDSSFALRPELRTVADGGTIFCRCEDVPLARVSACHSWREARLHTRSGMGPCQGRVCGGAAQFLFGWDTASRRPPLASTPIDRLLRPPSPAEHPLSEAT